MSDHLADLTDGRRRDETRAWYRATHGMFTIAVSDTLPRWLRCEDWELLGRGWTRFVHPGDHDRVRATTDLLQAGRLPPEPRVRRWIATDGGIVATQMRFLFARSPSGAVTHIIARIARESGA